MVAGRTQYDVPRSGEKTITYRCSTCGRHEEVVASYGR
jgi:hypothetical protein